jgi:hypothetical protein
MRTALRALCLALGLLTANNGRAADDPAIPAARADALFVAFVYNFCLFTRWPEADANQQEPFVILVTQGSTATFATLATRTVQGRPIIVRQLPATGPLPEECDVLVCEGISKKRRQALLDDARLRPVLTVSRERGFCAAGGIVEFFLKEQRLRFNISAENMARSKVRIESRLLKLSEPLEDDGGEE